jgi:hypothetical protein
VEKWRKHKENRGREKDLKIHRKQKTERGKNRGRTEEERASTYQLHHRLRPQATASPPAAPGNRKKKNREEPGRRRKKTEGERDREGKKQREKGKHRRRQKKRKGGGRTQRSEKQKADITNRLQRLL